MEENPGISPVLSHETFADYGSWAIWLEVHLVTSRRRMKMQERDF